MQFDDISPAQRATGLGALLAVAQVHGGVTDEERELLRACAHVMNIDDALTGLEPASPEQAAAAITDPVWRHRLVQALVVVATIDGEATADELAAVERYARVLEVDDPRVRSLHHLVHGHMLRLRLDMMRRFPIVRQLVGDTWSEEGLPGIFRLAKTLGGRANDPDLAWRYRRLGLLPEGTLGREFWAHMTSRGFAFPGEPGGIAERACHHDLTHVLTGYDTDPPGECQIAAFYAGYKREDPFAFLFGTLVMFQLGAKLSPIATPARLQWRPELVLRAMERGSHVTRDLTDHWDYWADMALPLPEVRARYGIPEA